MATSAKIKPQNNIKGIHKMEQVNFATLKGCVRMHRSFMGIEMLVNN